MVLHHLGPPVRDKGARTHMKNFAGEPSSLIDLLNVIEIGVEIGDDTQVGALSFVPKHSKLSGGAVYAGTPVKRIDRSPGGVDVTPA